MTTVLRLQTSELNTNLLEAIKLAFAGSTELWITISDEADETMRQLSAEANKTHLYKSMEEMDDANEIVTMTLEDFQAKYGK